MRKSPATPPLSIITSDKRALTPPRPLGKEGTQLWNAVQREYGIADVGGTELLMQVCLAEDRVEALRAQIDADGEVVRTRSGPRAHPALRDEIQLRAFIVRTIEKLGISVEAVKPVGRPPSKFGWTGDDR